MTSEKTKCDNIDEAFIELLPQEKKEGHKKLVVPPKDYNETSNGLVKVFINIDSVNLIDISGIDAGIYFISSGGKTHKLVVKYF